MRIFKNKAFDRWANGVELSDDDLKLAVSEISNGLYEANLGGNIYKKRIALQGRGKSSGARTIVAFKADKHTFFIYGFAKNERANISEQEEIALKKLAKIYFGFSDVQITQAIQAGQLVEVK
ncbi:MAG: type II toxin-antitoxin system RelE/ParE family toxin [Verrucomicrobia bacterium]|nr:type II toxin-antitoxin system RelE/ParE family toxin [Verrucomicrobiota bacterium]